MDGRTDGWMYRPTNRLTSPLILTPTPSPPFRSRTPGGGTVYHTGFTYATGTGAGAYFGAGVTHVNGGGSLTYIGGAYTSFTITTIFAGIGGWVFQGSGSSTFIAIPQSRYGVTRSVVRGPAASQCLICRTTWCNDKYYDRS